MPATELLGSFEHRVLLACLHRGGGAYTASVVNELAERTGRDVAPAAVYIALKRLEQRGLVVSELRTESGAGDQRERRYFVPTPEGMELLRQAHGELVALARGLEPHLKETRS